MDRVLLLVDDEENVTASLARLLRRDGYQILTATSGKVALGILEQHRVGVVITDQRMPEMTGIELLTQVRDHHPDTIRMVLSGYADLDSVKAAVNQGSVYKYLTKPWDDEVLRSNVTEAFLHYELAQERERLSREIQAANQTLMRINQEMAALVKEKDQRIEQIVHFDTITNLPNRFLFCDRLKQALAQAERNGKLVVVMLLDLDRFKNINESLGHPVGDKLLGAVAERLVSCIRTGDTVARTGGDDFSFALIGFGHYHEAGEKAQEFLELLSAPFLIEGHEIFITSSIGVSVSPMDGKDTTTLIKNAETAMYHAKEQGRSNFQFYTEQMNASSLQRLLLEGVLRRALERNEFLLYYQPQISLESGKIIGMEALLRWQHPEKGLMAPAQFIPILEETGLIVPVGEWVLRAAATQIKQWQAMEFPRLRVAVNLSALQFRQPGLSQIIATILDEVGLNYASGCLEVELTESLIMKDVEGTIATLKSLHEMGVQISIDDFGTGYSSLSYLKRFPIDTLKIDQSFVRDLSTSPDDASIVTAIIALGHSLKLKVIAEGVETKEQLAFLQASKCDDVQGYLFSKPLPAAEITRLLQEGKLLYIKEA
ncbi:putative bifunctional diguanylate cyclase/phosphodiesterase [Sulfurirhabdus autotrophica]|uniref:Diguanylate cyclase (GGDEF)-like protein n=1 Tax=Sulfurirhabdus autotrophica TaxID=1706046 RepID=A0A4R3YC59_9PROT|nr:EAL domain-containing protein [Sulfurirhabdus autotrophica]TCV89657.1 diguanylate cyclase (GGDEF)-like protein [Sulfurirhabdus autotrophica]